MIDKKDLPLFEIEDTNETCFLCGKRLQRINGVLATVCPDCSMKIEDEKYRNRIKEVIENTEREKERKEQERMEKREAQESYKDRQYKG